MFPPPSPSSAANPPSRRPKRAKPSSNDNLTLPFDTPAKIPPQLEDDEKVIEEPDESFTLGAGEDLPPPQAEEEPPPFDEPPSFADEPAVFDEAEEEEEEEEEPPPPPPPRAAKSRREVPRRPRPEPEEAMVFGDDELPPAAARGDDDRTKLRILGIFLAIVVVAYALLWRTLVAEPALADRWLGNVPVVGALATERLLAREIRLHDLAGRYDRIRHGRGDEVFIISGNAMSLATEPLHSVRIRGRALDGEGNVLDQKAIYCGNAVSAAILNDLTPREVSVLQKIQPPARFTIAPGDTKSFLIVFMDPPPGIAAFTAEVVGARRP